MFTIDRIEGGYAVCIDDNGKPHDIELSLIESGAKSGDVISDGAYGYKILRDETQKRRAEISALQDDLFE